MPFELLHLFLKKISRKKWRLNKNFIISSLNFLIELKEEFVWNFKMARGDELIFEEPFWKSFNGSRKVFDREYTTSTLFIKFSETLESEFSSQIINSIKLFVKHQIFDNKIFNTLDKNMFAFTHLRWACNKNSHSYSYSHTFLVLTKMWLFGCGKDFLLFLENFVKQDGNWSFLAIHDPLFRELFQKWPFLLI